MSSTAKLTSVGDSGAIYVGKSNGTISSTLLSPLEDVVAGRITNGTRTAKVMNKMIRTKAQEITVRKVRLTLLAVAGMALIR